MRFTSRIRIAHFFLGLLITTCLLSGWAYTSELSAVIRIHVISGIFAVFTSILLVIYRVLDPDPFSTTNIRPMQYEWVNIVSKVARWSLYSFIFVQTFTGIYGAAELGFLGYLLTFKEYATISTAPPVSFLIELHKSISGLVIGAIVLHLVGLYLHKLLKNDGVAELMFKNKSGTHPE